MPTPRTRRDALPRTRRLARRSPALAARSGRALSLLILLLVLIMLGVGLWYALGTGSPSEELTAVEEAADKAPADRSLTLAPPPDAPGPPSDDREELDPAATTDAAVQQTPPHLDETIERVRLTGRAVLPPNTPADEHALVIAVGREMTHQALASTPSPIEEALRDHGLHHLLLAVAELDEDGNYAIDVPEDRDVIHLALIGRYVAPLVTMRVDVPQAGELPVLTAELGAWITGRVVFPSGVAVNAKLLEDAEVEQGPDVTGGFDAMSISSTAAERKVELSDDGGFSMHALIEPGRKGIAWQHDDYAGGLMLGLDPEPGEHLELELRYENGGVVAGRVTDDRGRPISGVEVGIRYRGALGQMVGKLRKDESDDDGRFRLEHLPPGEFQLRAEHPEWKTSRLDVKEALAAGGKVEGVEVLMDAGARFVGTVLFPSGDPASGARVTASVDFSGEVGGLGTGVDPEDGGSTNCDDAGAFEIRGLGGGKFHLEASVDVLEGPNAGSWGLRRSGMLATGEELTLELEKLAALRGFVVDRRGSPVANFEARGTLEGSGAMFGVGAERKQDHVTESTDGQFRLSGLRPGTWQVRITAEGYARSKVQEIALPIPDDAPPLVFELQPSATVEGVVLDSLGEPVSGARVALQLELAERVQQQMEGGGSAAFSGSDGRFRLEGLDPGPAALEATREGFAASEAVAIDLTAGEVTRDVTLALRTGGTLTGVVLTPEGDPRPGRSVILQLMPSVDKQHILESGPDGSFAKEHLEPGSWQIVVMANMMTQGADAASEEGVAQTLGDMIIERVTIKEGETTHVVLGVSEGRPIEVSGQVTHAGEGVSKSIVSFVPEDSESMGDLKMAVTDGEGRYHVTLQRRGSWLVTVQNSVSTGRQNSIEFLERMPDEGETLDLDLELPGGRVTGRVLGPQHKPVANCRITLNVEGGISYGSFLGGHYTETVTDSEGRYEIKFLRAGRYAIAAGGPELGGMFGDDAPYGRTVRGGVEVGDGEWLEGIDFELKDPGDLQGVVLDVTGQPLPDAAIFLRDAAGRMVERFSLVATDGRGAFTYRGLAPGTYTAFARSAGLVSATSRPIEIRSGSVSNVELRMEEGCVVLVKVEDSSGVEVRARISIVDEDGREHTGAMSMSEIMEQFGKGFSSKEQRVGPVPLGRYQVRAVAEDGREVSRPVSFLRPGERSVRLRFK
ncbi:MAG: carboxypeptidase regulatory-like domain-containing protein [Planctomycetes bacterium]|nr:carboxypeptidase regulatory-like domain-containing protein [Planctomycetota bacterium]MCB9905819.1 carboxypeptidase regulatory-like domain-containing protein [Planctomycetota bacterium]